MSRGRLAVAVVVLALAALAAWRCLRPGSAEPDAVGGPAAEPDGEVAPTQAVLVGHRAPAATPDEPGDAEEAAPSAPRDAGRIVDWDWHGQPDRRYLHSPTEIRVEDPDGQPVVGATLRLRPAAGPPADGVEEADRPARGCFPPEPLDEATDYAGVARFRIDPETAAFDVDAGPPPERLDLMAVEVARWRPADRVVCLARAAPLRGTVRDPRGQPIAWARIDVRRADDRWEDTAVRTDLRGRFTLPRMPVASATTLRSLYPDCASPSSRTTLVEARGGEQGVALVADASAEIVLHVAEWKASGDGEARWSCRREDTEISSGVQTLLAGGTIRFRDVEPGSTYEVLVSGPPGSSSAVLLEDVALDRVPREIRLACAVDALVRVEGLSDEDEGLAVVAVHGGIRITGDREDDGTWRLAGVPPGEWTVVGRAERPTPKTPDGWARASRLLRAQACLERGATTVLRFGERDDR